LLAQHTADRNVAQSLRLAAAEAAPIDSEKLDLKNAWN
jgi:hypothetical protein